MPKITNHLIEYVTLSDEIIHRLNQIDLLKQQIDGLRMEQSKHRLEIASTVLDLGQEQQYLHFKTPENRQFFIHVCPVWENSPIAVDIDPEDGDRPLYEVDITELSPIRNHGEEE